MQQCHFPEKIALFEDVNHAFPTVFALKYLHRPGLNDVHGIAGIALPENDFTPPVVVRKVQRPVPLSALACRVDPNQPKCGQPQLVSDSRLAGRTRCVSAPPLRQKKMQPFSLQKGKGLQRRENVLILKWFNSDQGDPYHIIPSGLFKSPDHANVLFSTLTLAKGFIAIFLLFTFTRFEMYHLKDYTKANIRIGTTLNIIAFSLPYYFDNTCQQKIKQATALIRCGGRCYS